MTEPFASSFVVGTAGHIDHGKSTLVKALTQIDPDRLEEEKRRGMTIDLGFAYLQLPSGRRVGIVDVPGHQRFLKNMLAGVHGMDAVMLVVAADEGPMPQTREHLAIIDLLAIQHGVAVLTKADLVDAAWLSLVREEVARLLRGTSLQRAPIVAVSGTSGDGLDELRAALDAELGQTTPRPDVGRPRLPVDRSFAMAGFGTVVTGTLVGGALRQGDDLVVLPGERRVRIRGLQQHNRPVEEARPGSRTAVNLSGVDHAQLGRGHVLALPGSLPVSRRLDARLVVLPNATQPLRHRQRLLIYHETAEAMVELSLLEADELRPGEEGWGQLYVTSPMVALDGDRFILRVPSPALTVAGGVIVDSAPRRHRRKDAVVLSELGLRERADPGTAVVLELGKHAWGLSEGDLGRRLGGSRQQLADTLAPVADRGAIRRLGSRWVTREQWERLSARVTAALAVYHQGQPLRSGMPKEELRSRTGIPAELFNPALVALTGDGVVVERNGEVAAAGHRHGLTPEQESAAGAFLADLELQPFNPPPLADLVRRHQLAPSLVQYLVTQGRIVRVNDDTVFARSAYDDAVGRLRTHLSEHRTLTVAAARDVLGSSRRYVLPLLEWLDAQKITRRVGDDRILRG
ncbi:MAG: selenocysteine-specific translation elongation factor [Chloroflexi bacterium 13_1_20CM_66_33]|nr:MAG: selenocysteine-specific translation elongation factor [Chloroflexi bacterium 13_1_20CM_66_33]